MKKLECHVNLPIMWSIALWHTTSVSYKGYEKWFLMSQMNVLQECQPWGLQVVGVYNVVNKHAFSSRQYDVSQLCCYEWSFLPALVHKLKTSCHFFSKKEPISLRIVLMLLRGIWRDIPNSFQPSLFVFDTDFFCVFWSSASCLFICK